MMTGQALTLTPAIDMRQHLAHFNQPNWTPARLCRAARLRSRNDEWGPLTKPQHAHLRIADQLLRLQGVGAGGAVGWAAAARGVHDTLRVQLMPIIGAAGFEALFRRSVKLTGMKFETLDPDVHASLGTLEQPAAAEVATALVATFLALLATFVGDALTSQVLKIAFPACSEIGPKETEK